MATNDSIPERVKAQLSAIGVPADRQTKDSLVGFFPRELNISAAGLEAEDLAKVLVHFVGQGLFSISETGTATDIKGVQPGWHFCQFYKTNQQLLEIVAPYMAEGLRNNEGCLWVVPESVTSEAACAALARSLPDAGEYLASGQLEILSHPSWYLDDQGRLKSFEEVSGALLGKQDAALARGFKFLRAAGDTGWISGTEQSKEFVAYEMKINAAIGATQVAAVCTYRADVSADELVAIVTAHQDALRLTPAA